MCLKKVEAKGKSTTKPLLFPACALANKIASHSLSYGPAKMCTGVVRIIFALL